MNEEGFRLLFREDREVILDTSIHSLNENTSRTESNLEDGSIPSSSSQLSKEDVLYAIYAYCATSKPVAITLILSSLAVVYIKSDNPDINGDNEDLTVYKLTDDNNTSNLSYGQKLGESMINAIAIVSVVCLITFVMVFLYWVGCSKVISGYIMFSSTVLLGFMGGLFFFTFLDKFDLPCDIFTFSFFLYNFAVVGVISIFFSDGIPEWISQGYLIFVSVLLSWQFSKFDEWTTWSLLIMLAVYDLFAVLTPCGPLKALVRLMQTRPNEQLPGLLYEARLPPTDLSSNHPPTNTTGLGSNHSSHISSPNSSVEGDIEITKDGFHRQRSSKRRSLTRDHLGKYSSLEIENEKIVEQDDSIHSINPIHFVGMSTDQREDQIQENDSSQDQHEVEVKENNEERKQRVKRKSSVKLGLGDFIFYSVLVSRAALHGFTTFIICFIVILAGLGMTMILLAAYKQALPALPISIFLGVMSFFVTEFCIIPYLSEMYSQGILI